MPFANFPVPLVEAFSFVIVDAVPHTDGNSLQNGGRFTLAAQFYSTGVGNLPDGVDAIWSPNPPFAANIEDFSIPGGPDLNTTGEITDSGTGTIHGIAIDAGNDLYTVWADNIGSGIVTVALGLNVAGYDWQNVVFGSSHFGGGFNSVVGLMTQSVAGTTSGYIVSSVAGDPFNAWQMTDAEFADITRPYFGYANNFIALGDQVFWGVLYQGNAAAVISTNEVFEGPDFTYTLALLDFENVGNVAAQLVGRDHTYFYYVSLDNSTLYQVQLDFSGYFLIQLPPGIVDISMIYSGPDSFSYMLYSPDGASWLIAQMESAFPTPQRYVPQFSAARLPCVVNCVPLIDRRK